MKKLTLPNFVLLLSIKRSLLFSLGLLLSLSSVASDLQRDLLSQMKDSRDRITNHLNTENCATELSKLNRNYENIKSVDWSRYKGKRNTANLIKSMFYTRLEVRKKLFKMGQFKPVDKLCENEIRRSIVALRFLEEYTAKVSGFEDEVDVFKGAEPYLLINPKFKEFKLQTGDILISRGNAVVSAAIAQIGEQDGHFSHAALIYIEPDTKKVYAIEAHIEIGSDVEPIEKGYLTDGKVRAIVYRQKDPVLAYKAARIAYETVLAGKKNKKPILYNFAMNLDDESQLFCSQIPYMAYKYASGGQFIMGRDYMTTFGMKNKTFINNIGVNVSKTFSPSDTELDHQLELVAEWRDLGRAHQTHRKDVVVNRIYQWMEEGHNFDLSKKSFEVMLINVVRAMPLFNLVLKGKVSDSVTTPALKTMMVLNYVGDKMLDDLIVKYTAFLEQTGYPMTLDDMKLALEKARVEDLNRLHRHQMWKKDHPQCTPEGDMCLDEPERPHFIDFFQN